MKRKGRFQNPWGKGGEYYNQSAVGGSQQNIEPPTSLVSGDNFHTRQTSTETPSSTTDSINAGRLLQYEEDETEAYNPWAEDGEYYPDNVLDSKDPNDPKSVLYTTAVVRQNNEKGLSGCVFYALDGTWLGKIGNNTQVYVVSEKIITAKQGTENIIKNLPQISSALTKNEWREQGIKNLNWYISNSVNLGISDEKLLEISATSFAESSSPYGIDDKNEIYAIAYVHKSFPNHTAYGKGTDEYSRFLRLNPEKRNVKFYQVCIGAVINAFLNGEDKSNGASHWDGIDILCGRASYDWKPLNHPKQRAEGKYKGISDPKNLASVYYDRVKEYLDKKISSPTLNEDLRNDFKAKRQHLKKLHVYSEKYINNDNNELKFLPLYEIRATYALTIFYKKLK